MNLLSVSTQWAAIPVSVSAVLRVMEKTALVSNKSSFNLQLEKLVLLHQSVDFL